MRASWLLSSIAFVAVAPATAWIARALPSGGTFAAPAAAATPSTSIAGIDGGRVEATPSAHRYLGVVLPREATNVAPSLAGKVVSVAVRIGDHVRANDVLATLDARLVAADLAAARATARTQAANRQMARAAHEVAIEHERRVTLMEAEGLSTREDLINRTKEQRIAGMQVVAAEASVAQSEAQAERLQRESDLMTVRAPFDGTVVARYVDPGTSISATTLTPIVRLISSDRLFVRFAVTERDAPELHPGANIEAFPQAGSKRVLHGRIERIAPEVDTSTHVALAEASIEEHDDDIISGLVVDVTIPPR